MNRGEEVKSLVGLLLMSANARMEAALLKRRTTTRAVSAKFNHSRFEDFPTFQQAETALRNCILLPLRSAADREQRGDRPGEVRVRGHQLSRRALLLPRQPLRAR